MLAVLDHSQSAERLCDDFVSEVKEGSIKNRVLRHFKGRRIGLRVEVAVNGAHCVGDVKMRDAGRPQSGLGRLGV